MFYNGRVNFILLKRVFLLKLKRLSRFVYHPHLVTEEVQLVLQTTLLQMNVEVASKETSYYWVTKGE
ncbi:hypothetical protein Fmac_003936 [Flemingia macrophylla]|uniref:Uncharacterized protein n=1 Tax=Flemingia macrophylla TaxID=520843 RepID=A0ABD1N3K2_9FABA